MARPCDHLRMRLAAKRMRRRTAVAAGSVAIAIGLATAAPGRAAVSGGEYTAYTGEQVTVLITDSYTKSDAVLQTYADFVAALFHGKEISKLTILLVSPSELAAICTGEEKYACYYPTYQTIVITPDSPTRGTELMHEYAHHLAYNRSNQPFDSLEYGPKRWASYVGVCPYLEQGSFDLDRPKLDPYEGFAEAYTLVNGGPWSGTVDRAFYPDKIASRRIYEDALMPWKKNTTKAFHFRLADDQPVVRRIATPLDGSLELHLRGPSRADVHVALLYGHTVVKHALGLGSVKTLRYRVCGERRLRFIVTAVNGSGPATVTVSRP